MKLRALDGAMYVIKPLKKFKGKSAATGLRKRKA